MSDAMTNREIEDVLTSIRRLVAQEGGRGAEAGRLILTEAHRVNAARNAPEPRDEDAEAAAAEAVPAPEGPMPDKSHVSIPAPDFGKLEATIAELEAAVSGEYEGDGVADSPRASNVTELYGRLSFAHRAKETEAAVPAPDRAAPGPADAPAPADPASAEAAEYVEPAPHDLEPQPAQDGADEAAADEAAGDEDETLIDEETLRQLIAQIVRDELHGQLGERITQQVRKLVRAEIAKALDERSYL